jgi:hypothetical protein
VVLDFYEESLVPILKNKSKVFWVPFFKNKIKILILVLGFILKNKTKSHF